jgi:hypothetical protein
MNAVRSVKNQYVGVNAHLHSELQAESGMWVDFHGAHIADLAVILKQKLHPLGYTAAMEQSLQIRRLGEYSFRPKSDVLVYDTQPARSITPYSQPDYVQTMPLDELLNDIEEETFRAIVVYELDRITRKRGEPVAWFELLSPSNKGSTPDAYTFAAKRRDLLKSGLVYIEMDYLHETLPTFETLSAEQPYRIIVIDPRPTMHEGRAKVALFSVDSAIPTVRIPLSGHDTVDFDFGSAYQKTFEEGLYGSEFVNYAEYPVNFDRYTPADQARIANRMLAVLEAAHNGLDLERAPFPTANLTLDEARARIETLKR